MQPYVYEGRLVQAMQWFGAPTDGIQIEHRPWGIVGAVDTGAGPVWVSEGDWVVVDGDDRRIVSDAIFALRYQPA